MHAKSTKAYKKSQGALDVFKKAIIALVLLFLLLMLIIKYAHKTPKTVLGCESHGGECVEKCDTDELALYHADCASRNDGKNYCCPKPGE